jgi:hypothetical protein
MPRSLELQLISSGRDFQARHKALMTPAMGVIFFAKSDRLLGKEGNDAH